MFIDVLEIKPHTDISCHDNVTDGRQGREWEETKNWKGGSP